MPHSNRVASTFLLFLALSGMIGCGDSGLQIGIGTLPEPKKLDQSAALAAYRSGGSAIAPQQPASPASQSDRSISADEKPRSMVTIKPYDQWSYSETAIDSLGRIGKPAVSKLVELLDDPNPLVRYRAARILARIGPDAVDAVPILIKHLNDVDFLVRREAARALGHIGPAAEEAVPALIQALRSEELLDESEASDASTRKDESHVDAE